MTAWITPASVLRVPARMELWSWATRSVPLSFARNSAISTPYTDTTPMIALREYPIPGTRLDSSIFEVSEEDEYRSVAQSFKHSITATTPITTNSSGLSSSSLLQLVRQRDYASANRLRTEMIQYHLPIAPDHAFIWPAIYAANSSLDPAIRLKEFSEWMSLLPVADEGKNPRPMFGRLVHLLSNNPQVDVDLVMAFVRICISKGYIVKIPDPMIPLVVRFAPPSVSLHFLEDLYSSVVKKFALDRQLKRKIRVWCNIAMSEYTSIGLADDAKKAFQMGLQYSRSPRVSSRRSGKAVTKDPDHPELSREAIAAFKRPKTRLPHYRGPSHRRSLMSDTSTLSPMGFDTSPPNPKALLSRAWEHTPSGAFDIACFLEVFDSQPATVQLLSAYNQRRTAQYRKQWILGEMLYYARRKEWRELIGTFDTRFFRVGVPENIDEYKSRGRVTALNVQQRLFPSPYHTSLVWMAVVEILQRARPVSMLFKELVEQATAAKTRKYAQVGPSLIFPSAGMFDAGHFAPFLVESYRKRRYKHLVEIFGEMDRLGIEAGLHHLSLLAGAYAGMSEGHEAVRVLDRIEDGLKEKGAKRPPRPHHRISRNVNLYIPALKGFMTKKNIPGASLVERRILAHGYVRGTSPYVDWELAKLERSPADCYPWVEKLGSR